MKQKSRIIIVFILCMLASGCAPQFANWSMHEVAWFSWAALLITGWLIYSANRITLQKAGPSRAGVEAVLCFPGLFFLVWGSKLNLIHDFGSAVPFWDQWGFEGGLYQMVLNSRLDPSMLFAHANVHRPLFTRLLLVMLLKMNGQWDPVVTMTADALLYSLILTGLCLVLWRLAGRKNLALFTIIAGIIGVSHFGWETTIGGMHASFYFILGFSVLAIILLVFSKPLTVSWFLGLAATLMAQFSVASGLLATLAVACVLIFNCISGSQKLKESWPAIVVLFVVAFMEYLLVPYSHETLSQNIDHIRILTIFGRAAAFPFPVWPLAAIMWLPFSILVFRQFRDKRTSPLAQLLLALGTWSLLQSVVLACYRGGAGSRHADLQSVGLLVNLIITFYLFALHSPPSKFPGPYKKAMWLGAGILVFSTANATLHFKERPSLIIHHINSGIQEKNTARYVLTGDPSSIVNQPRLHIPVPPYLAGDLMKALDDPTIRKILPTCIRAPLPLEPDISQGFSPGAIPPELPALPDGRVFGSWSADKRVAKAEYLSRPVSSSYRWLVFDIAGGGAGASLEMIPSRGPAIPVDVGEQSRRWKKVVVKAPGGPFRLQATERSKDGWIAFSSPRELAGGGYYTRRLLSGNLFVTLFGMIGLLAGLITLSKGDPSFDHSGNAVFRHQ